MTHINRFLAWSINYWGIIRLLRQPSIPSRVPHIKSFISLQSWIYIHIYPHWCFRYNKLFYVLPSILDWIIYVQNQKSKKYISHRALIKRREVIRRVINWIDKRWSLFSLELGRNCATILTNSVCFVHVHKYVNLNTHSLRVRSVLKSMFAVLGRPLGRFHSHLSRDVLLVVFTSIFQHDLIIRKACSI